MTLPMKAYALAMYPLCWAAWAVFMVLPFHMSAAPRVSRWLLPWAGMYAYSESFKDFCQCKPFRRKA